MDISNAPSRVSPWRLQKYGGLAGGGGRDNRLNNVLIYTATPSVTCLQTLLVIHNNRSKSKSGRPGGGGDRGLERGTIHSQF